MKKQLTLMFAIIIIATSVKAQRTTPTKDEYNKVFKSKDVESGLIGLLAKYSTPTPIPTSTSTSFKDELIGYWRLTSKSFSGVHTDYEKNVITFENMDRLLALDKTGEVKKELDNYKKENDGKLIKDYMQFSENNIFYYFQNGNKWTGTSEFVREGFMDKLHINGGIQKNYSMYTIELIKNKSILKLYESEGVVSFVSSYTKMNDNEIEKFKEIKFKEYNETVNKLIAEAQIQLNSGNTIEYKKLLERAVQIDPNNVELVYNLGVIAHEAKDFIIAKNYYEKVIKLDSNYAAAYHNIAAIILEGQNNIINEMNSLGSSKADDDRYEALNNQRLLIYRSVIPYYEKVIQIDKSKREIINTLMSIYEILGEDKEYERLKKM